MSGQPVEMKRTKWRRLALLAAALVLLTGVGLVGLRLSRRPPTPPADSSAGSAAPADPRRAYDGPYRNIDPDVRYVGAASCAGCHDAIARNYARHPMGRSLVAAEAPLDRRSTPDTNNPFLALGRRFEADRRGERLWHRQVLLDDSGKPVVESAQEVRWMIGSGAKGYAYLSEHDGYLLQTPISWFSQARSASDGTQEREMASKTAPPQARSASDGTRGRWDLSPGFGPAVLAGRLVPASCLFCHADRPREHPEHPDRFVPPVFEGRGIGCERCHGPGERHVRSEDRWDIVNPARLAPRLRDAVCEQCHLEGEARVLRAGRKLFDFRPGLPLHDFWGVLVRGRQAGEDGKAVNHVEQMYQSKCFSRPVGDRQLGCTTCHDPHVHVGAGERPTAYRARCLLCHDGTGGPPVCSELLPLRKQASPGDNCIDCHMPRYRSSDIAHTASTDHRVVRRPAPQLHEADLEGAALVDFYRDRFPGGDPQAERTRGLGLVKLMRTYVLDPRRHADRALRFLEAALASEPSDVPLRAGKVEAYLLLGRPAEALSEAELLVPQRPGDWPLLVQAAYAAEACGETDRSRDYWRRAVHINPAVPDFQVHLLNLLGRPEDADEAWQCCEQLLCLDPFNVTGRQARVRLLLLQGRQTEARRDLDIVRQLKPRQSRQ
jgi:hypothetical protein